MNRILMVLVVLSFVVSSVPMARAGGAKTPAAAQIRTPVQTPPAGQIGVGYAGREFRRTDRRVDRQGDRQQRRQEYRQSTGGGTAKPMWKQILGLPN